MIAPTCGIYKPNLSPTPRRKAEIASDLASASSRMARLADRVADPFTVCLGAEEFESLICDIERLGIGIGRLSAELRQGGQQ